VRYCAAAGDAAARAMLAAAAPGVTEAEVYAAGMAAAFRLGCPASTLMWSGPGFVAWGPPIWSYRPEPPRALEDGDVLLAEVVTRFGMKETRHHVAIAIGGPHPDIETAAAGTGNVVGVRAQRGRRRPGGKPGRHRPHRRGRPDRTQPLHRPDAPRPSRTPRGRPPGDK
jgi:hypothetical protein